MNQVNLLRDTLKQHLPWHGARLNSLALFLMALIRVRTVKWVLSIDRTQWCFGSTCFNIFVLGIVHNGVAFPIIWTMLEES